MDRQHRHDLKHDKFVDEIGALSQRAQANQRLLLTIGVAVVVIAAASYGFFFYRGNQEKKAQALLATAIETIEAPVGDTPQQPGAPAGPKFKTTEERSAAAEKQFREVQSKYPGSTAADVAGLYMARLTLTKGDTANARKALESFIDDHGDHPLLGKSARYSLYQLRIESGEAAQVIVELTAELNKPEPVLPGDALLVLMAQAYDVQGNSEKARETYRRITTEFPESQYAVEAARRAGTA